MQPRGVREYYAYILSNNSQILYIGMTGEFESRMHQHLNDRDPKSFVARYNLDRLVHLEVFPTADQAMAREKQLKGWSRIKKKRLISENNPTWRNLLQS